MHEAIIEDHLKDATPVDNPQAIMMGGGTASGKSTLIKSGDVEIPKNLVTVDSDKIKAALPEFNAKMAAGDPKAASFAYEESSYLSKEIASRASKGGYNVMLDGTGDSSVEGLGRKCEMMRQGGQPVHGVYASVPTKVAHERNRARAERNPDRTLVNPAFVSNVHASVSRVYPEAVKRGFYDTTKLYDTTARGNPVLMASSKGTVLTVHNQTLYNSFVAKGTEK